MMKEAQRSPANIEVISATLEQAPILANLLELYIHDFSEFLELAPGPDGRFGYDQAPLYWSDPCRYPFLAWVDGELAGLVLIKSDSNRETAPAEDAALWDIAEFFILRGYRRRGIGTQIAHEVWRRFPGNWQVRVMEINPSAIRFWERAIAEFTGQPTAFQNMEKDGKSWRVFSFESKKVEAS